MKFEKGDKVKIIMYPEKEAQIISGYRMDGYLNEPLYFLEGMVPLPGLENQFPEWQLENEN